MSVSFIVTKRQLIRITWLNLVMVFFGAIVGWRLFQLQIVSHKHYVALASQSQNRRYEVPAKRGQIYLLDGENKVPLALNQNLKLLYADPTKVKDKVKAAKALTELVGESEKAIYEKLLLPGEYVVLKRGLTSAQIEQIMALRLVGVGSSDQASRIYPEGQLAAQVAGFVNQDGVGQYGLEGFLNEELTGKAGLLKAETDTRGNPIATSDNIVTPPTNGKSFVLTIDRNIQAQAEKFLKEGVESVKATSGSVVIIDPASGAVRAMANWPTYDPNQFVLVKDYGLFSNSVVSSQFEPGSGFKVITMAAGLDTGKVRADTTFDDTGLVELDGRKIRNAENHKFGVQNMTDVIQKSLNTGVIFVLKSLGGDLNTINLAGKKVFYEYVTKKFGFGVPTGIEQVGEASGHINQPTKNNGNNVNYANMTFGQGLSVTMLQMTNAVASIANGGKLYQPHLIDSTIDGDQHIVKTQPKIINPRVVSPEVARQLTDMMVQVVEKGSGWQAKMKGYKVAGKTGTAQIPRADGKGYEEGKNIGSFVGYAPAHDPKFVMMVRINEPKVPGFAESTTVPVFARISEWLMKYYAVPPQ